MRRCPYDLKGARPLLIEHMLDCIEHIEVFTQGGKTSFLESRLIQDAVVRNLQVMAESSQRLSQDAKAAQSRIDWPAISGFRNILVHDYFGIDLEAVWLVIEDELPVLKDSLIALSERHST